MVKMMYESVEQDVLLLAGPKLYLPTEIIYCYVISVPGHFCA